jgi:hypothetical protein
MWQVRSRRHANDRNGSDAIRQGWLAGGWIEAAAISWTIRAGVRLLTGGDEMAQKNERVELEMKIMKYRLLARCDMHDETAPRIDLLVAELEQKLREIDE